jgi:hypothetical protein
MASNLIDNEACMLMAVDRAHPSERDGDNAYGSPQRVCCSLRAAAGGQRSTTTSDGTGPLFAYQHESEMSLSRR